MKYAFRKQIGTAFVLGTEWPIVAVAYGSGRSWVSAFLCNGIAHHAAEHKTRRDAVERAERLTVQEGSTDLAGVTA